MPENLFHAEPDIRQLAVERPTSEFVLFNPERDFTEFDWNFGLSELERVRNNSLIDFAQGAYTMKLLAPDRAHQLPLGEEVWQELLKTMRSHQTKESIVGLQQLRYVQALFPDRYEEIDVRSVYMETQNRINGRLSARQDVKLVEELANFRVVFPDRWQLFLMTRPNVQWDRIIQSIGRNGLIQDKNDAMLMTLPELACLRAVSQYQFDMVFTESMQADARHLFETYRRKPLYLDIYGYLATISASELRFTERGLELVFSKREDEHEAQSLPNVRNY